MSGNKQKVQGLISGFPAQAQVSYALNSYDSFKTVYFGRGSTGLETFVYFCFPLYCSTRAEKAMATHPSTLAWKTPWTEGPGGLQSMGSLGVGYD